MIFDSHLHIFDPQAFPEKIPPGCKAVCMPLDARQKSNLEWTNEIQKAKELVEKGYKLVWDLRLGLFQELLHPLSNQTQFLSLGLAIDHFRDTIWKQFKDSTIGVILYRGTCDFMQSVHWDRTNYNGWLEEQGLEPSLRLERFFCRDTALEYMHLLTTRLPDGIEKFIVLENISHASLLDEAQYFSKDQFEPLQIILDSSCLPVATSIWDAKNQIIKSLSSEKGTIGVCLPSGFAVQYGKLEEVLKKLRENKINYRIIPEDILISEWDGLDDLIVLGEGLGPQGKRKLQGFCAAGGRVISVDGVIGLVNEVGIDEFWGHFFTTEAQRHRGSEERG